MNIFKKLNLVSGVRLSRPPSARIISFGWYRLLTSCKSASVSKASGLPAITTCLGEDADASRATSISGREDGDRDNWTRKALTVFSAIRAQSLLSKNHESRVRLRAETELGEGSAPSKSPFVFNNKFGSFPLVVK